MRAAIRGLLPWPLRWQAGPLTARCQFDNLAKMPSVTCPILVVYGLEDTFVPGKMSLQLASAAKSKVTALPVAGAGHADIWDTGGEALWREIADWILPAIVAVR